MLISANLLRCQGVCGCGGVYVRVCAGVCEGVCYAGVWHNKYNCVQFALHAHKLNCNQLEPGNIWLIYVKPRSTLLSPPLFPLLSLLPSLPYTHRLSEQPKFFIIFVLRFIINVLEFRLLCKSVCCAAFRQPDITTKSIKEGEREKER